MEYEINESCSTAPSIPASYLTRPRLSFAQKSSQWVFMPSTEMLRVLSE